MVRGNQAGSQAASSAVLAVTVGLPNESLPLAVESSEVQLEEFLGSYILVVWHEYFLWFIINKKTSETLQASSDDTDRSPGPPGPAAGRVIVEHRDCGTLVSVELNLI